MRKHENNNKPPLCGIVGVCEQVLPTISRKKKDYASKLATRRTHRLLFKNGIGIKTRISRY